MWVHKISQMGVKSKDQTKLVDLYLVGYFHPSSKEFVEVYRDLELKASEQMVNYLNGGGTPEVANAIEALSFAIENLSFRVGNS